MKSRMQQSLALVLAIVATVWITSAIEDGLDPVFNNPAGSPPYPLEGKYRYPKVETSWKFLSTK